MTLVTARPYPNPANGIGIWQEVIETLGLMAILINVGLAVLVMQPLSEWKYTDQIMWILILEHACILVKMCIMSIIPAVPDDVRLIDDLNEAFSMSQRKVGKLQIADADRVDSSKVHKDMGIPKESGSSPKKPSVVKSNASEAGSVKSISESEL